MEVVLAYFKGTVPATSWRNWGKLNTSVSITNLYKQYLNPWPPR